MNSRIMAAAVALALGIGGCGESLEEPVSLQSQGSKKGGDLDCSDVSWEEAQALLADGDPHGLDRDGDGEACNSNR